MAEVEGRCPLCLQDRELVESRLMPRALYKKFRDESGGDPNPVVTVDGGKSHQTSKQVSDHVLCGVCEGTLSRSGEKHVLARILQTDGTFPLQDSLKSGKPYTIGSQAGAFDIATLEDVSPAHFTHFAAGVFWKASVHNWTYRDSPPLRLDLPDEAQEGLRLFLLGESDWPESVVLNMFVAGEDNPLWAFFFPKRYETGAVHRSSFYVPGVEFYLHVGDDESIASVAGVALSGPGPASAVVLDLGKHGVLNQAVKAIGAAGPSRKLREWLEGDAT